MHDESMQKVRSSLKKNHTQEHQRAWSLLKLTMWRRKMMMNVEKLAEIAVKVVWQGVSAAVSSLAEFAITSADEHSMLVNHPEDVTSENSM
ncbi:unnamed protein product [Brassica rapa]|uniref:Uncharacterized protein n=2 Tax=Brassica campestris TaxID=3711 RepID=A0A8D9HIT1_BRACM|nr:unnamed protein product [Brassica rapa]